MIIILIIITNDTIITKALWLSFLFSPHPTPVKQYDQLYYGFFLIKNNRKDYFSEYL